MKSEEETLADEKRKAASETIKFDPDAVEPAEGDDEETDDKKQSEEDKEKDSEKKKKEDE